MANSFELMTVVSKDASRRLNAKNTVVANVNHQHDKPYKAFGSNSGTSIKIKNVQRLSALEVQTFSAQDYVEKTSTLDITNWTQIPVQFTEAELTSKLTDPSYMKGWGDEWLQPAIDAAVANLDSRAASYIIKNAATSLGTPGTGPNAYQIATKMRAYMKSQRAPDRDWVAIFNPSDAGLLNNAQSGLFNPNGAISDNFKDGTVAYNNGFRFYDSPNVGSLTTGAGSGYLVNGASQTGTSLIVDTGTGALTAGQKFTMGCKQVDPLTGATLADLKVFTVASDYAGGAGTITLTEAIITTGAYKNVHAAPADNVALTLIGSASTTYQQNIFMHKDAFCVGFARIADVGVKHEVPVITGGGNTYSGGIDGPTYGMYGKLSLDGDIGDLQCKARLDFRWGITALERQWSGVVQGQ
jgi:hypothetical protein